MPRAWKVCSVPGCPELCASGRCDQHRREAEQRRGTARQRGYDARWQRRRKAYLSEHLFCRLCRAPSTVADHWPVSRRDLVAQGVPDPDADHRLRPLCSSCHGYATSKAQPGGWNAR